MNHQWPPEVIRAMHQFADAAPVAPSLGSVLEQRQIAPSSPPPAADLRPEQRLTPMEEMIVSTKTPTSETRNRRRLSMAAAAVVVVVGIAAIAVANNRDDDQSPSATAVSTGAPATAVAPRRGAGVFEPSSPRVTYIMPDGWHGSGAGVWKSPNRQLPVFFVNTDDKFFINCPSSLLDPQVGPTVDDLVSALVNLPGVDAETKDVTIDGFDGKQIELTFPSHYVGEECSPDFAARRKGIPLYFRCNYGGKKWCDSLVEGVLPNQHQKIWVLDVDGSRLVIMAAFFPDTPQKDRADQDEIVASIQIG
jgi:hypothetical protein